MHVVAYQTGSRASLDHSLSHPCMLEPVPRASWAGCPKQPTPWTPYAMWSAGSSLCATCSVWLVLSPCAKCSELQGYHVPHIACGAGLPDWSCMQGLAQPYLDWSQSQCPELVQQDATCIVCPRPNLPCCVHDAWSSLCITCSMHGQGWCVLHMAHRVGLNNSTGRLLGCMFDTPY